MTAAVVDPVVESIDRLTRLPSEMQHIVISYLFPTHEPDKAFLETNHAKPTHPLDCLGATCRALRGEVNAWCRTYLTKHSDITKYKPFKTDKLQARRNFIRGRNGLLTWIEHNCVFCGKKSSRSAILVNGFHCCAKCDREQWPDKITKTDAREEYDLTDKHLLPHNHLARPSAKSITIRRGGLPTIRYGTYMSQNVVTTMFHRSDVRALAELVHGNLEAHLARRQVERNERRRKAQGNGWRKEALKLEHEAFTDLGVLTYDPSLGPPPSPGARPIPAPLLAALAEAREFSRWAQEAPFSLAPTEGTMDDLSIVNGVQAFTAQAGEEMSVEEDAMWRDLAASALAKGR